MQRHRCNCCNAHRNYNAFSLHDGRWDRDWKMIKFQWNLYILCNNNMYIFNVYPSIVIGSIRANRRVQFFFLSAISHAGCRSLNKLLVIFYASVNYLFSMANEPENTVTPNELFVLHQVYDTVLYRYSYNINIIWTLYTLYIYYTFIAFVSLVFRYLINKTLSNDWRKENRYI